jgi:X-Pro dipeptidyl-peptidase (S15 family)
LTKFLYGLPGLDAFVWADGTGKIYLVDIPAQKAVFVREGYEALRKPAPTDALLSAPTYEVAVDKSVAVPMRDGVKLVLDVYRPQGVEKAPVILVRTPYKKDMNELQARLLCPARLRLRGPGLPRPLQLFRRVGALCQRGKRWL